MFTDIFARETESHYNLSRCNDFRISPICTVYQHGSESVSFLGPKICNILPVSTKQQPSLNSLKKSVKNGSHKTAHSDFVKFILMVSVSFLSCHKCRKILLCVSCLLFFHSKDIDLFTFSTLFPK